MKALYLSRSKLTSSVNAVYIKGLRANGVEVDEMFVRRNEFFNLIKYLLENRKSWDLIFVGYDSPTLVPFAKIFSNKKVVYNALCSVYERLIISRKLASRYSIKAVYYWLSDFLAVHLANLTMVETMAQARFFKRFFKIPNSKLFVAWSGVDENSFKFNSEISKFLTFTVLFRGIFMPESGAEYVVQAAKILEKEDVKFIIKGGGLHWDKLREMIKELNPQNLELKLDFLDNDELSSLMQKCHLSLGQLSDHPRLIRTIPHKCYESLALKLPYLTVKNSGVLELLRPDETCLVCESADARSLANAIMNAKNNPNKLEIISTNGYNFYAQHLRSHILAGNLLKRINKL
nr:hypothetical protein [uncultured bacterium]